MRLSILLIASLLPLSCAAEPEAAPVAAPVPEAELVFSDAEEAAEYYYEQATTEVEETFHLIIQKIDADEYAHIDMPKDELDQMLITEQNRWEDYRAAHCATVRVMKDGDAYDGRVRHECFTRLNKLRTQELRDLYLYDREDSHSVDCCNKEGGSETGLWDLAPD